MKGGAASRGCKLLIMLQRSRDFVYSTSTLALAHITKNSLDTIHSIFASVECLKRYEHPRSIPCALWEDLRLCCYGFSGSTGISADVRGLAGVSLQKVWRLSLRQFAFSACLKAAIYRAAFYPQTNLTLTTIHISPPNLNQDQAWIPMRSTGPDKVSVYAGKKVLKSQSKQARTHPRESRCDTVLSKLHSSTEVSGGSGWMFAPHTPCSHSCLVPMQQAAVSHLAMGKSHTF